METGIPPIGKVTHVWHRVGDRWELTPREDVRPPESYPEVSIELSKPVPQTVLAPPPAPKPARAAMPSVVAPIPKPNEKITICVLCQGEETRLARACLDSVLATVPPDRLDLRVAGNSICENTRQYIRSLPVTKFYDYPENRFKYPAMRSLFWDSEYPITTSHVVWLDGDTKVVNGRWLDKLFDSIRINRVRGVGLYGWKHLHCLSSAKGGHNPAKWFLDADWHQGLHFRNRSGAPVPNGDCIHYVVGWCWAIATEVIRKANIPDIRLTCGGGDICIGEQVYQAGYKIAEFNRNKSLVFAPPKSRRGDSEPFPWSNPAPVA